MAIVSGLLLFMIFGIVEVSIGSTPTTLSEPS